MKVSKTTLYCLIVMASILFTSTRIWACCGGPPEGELTLKVEGLKTVDDAQRLELQLTSLKTITDCKVDLERKALGLVLQTGLITEEEVIELIKQAGFGATLPDQLDIRLNNPFPPEIVNKVCANLNNLLGVMVNNVDTRSNIIHIGIYKEWVRDVRKLLKAIHDAGADATLDSETHTFITEGMADVDAYDVKAYLLKVFGVISSDVDMDSEEVKVTFYKGWTSEAELLQVIEERGYTRIIPHLPMVND